MNPVPLDMGALLRRERLVPVLRATSERELRRQVELGLEAGLRVIEITTTSPGWERVLAETAELPDVVVGAGTVVTVELARTATRAGARFLVAPCAVPEVRSAATGVPVVEGGFSPSEVLTLARLCSVVKLFPASSGGIAHLRAIRDVAPHAAIMPTGGIAPDEAVRWIEAGAVAVGLGSALMRLGPSEIRSLQHELKEAA